MRIVLFIIIALVGAGYAVLVLWPGNPEVWHVDPAEAEEPGRMGVRASGEDAVRLEAAPDLVMASLDRIMAEDGANLFAGSLEERFVTYRIRTKVLRIPDYVTLRVAPTETGSMLTYRAVSGTHGYDWGVNAARMMRIIETLQTRLP